MKRYNSVALLAFTVEHDSDEEITEAEFWAGLERRIALLKTEPDGLEQACGSDWYDTCVNEYDDDGNPTQWHPDEIRAASVVAD